MDLLDEAGGLDLTDSRWTIYSRNPDLPAARIGTGAALDRCMIAEGCNVEGAVAHSVIFQGVRVRAGATVTDSLVMAGAIVGVDAQVHRAVIAEDAVIGEGCVVGEPGGAIAVIGQGAQLRAGCRVAAGQSVEPGAIVDGN